VCTTLKRQYSDFLLIFFLLDKIKTIKAAMAKVSIGQPSFSTGLE
jgi:hypothetical protein